MQHDDGKNHQSGLSETPPAMPPSPQDCNLDESSPIRFRCAEESRGPKIQGSMPMPDCLFVTLLLDWIEHLPELRIGEIGKLFSKNWSLPGQEQQLSLRWQIAYLIRGE